MGTKKSDRWMLTLSVVAFIALCSGMWFTVDDSVADVVGAEWVGTLAYEEVFCALLFARMLRACVFTRITTIDW